MCIRDRGAGIFVLPEVRLKKPGSFDILASLIFLAGMVLFLWGIKHLAAELAFDTQGEMCIRDRARRRRRLRSRVRGRCHFFGRCFGLGIR